MSGNGHIKIQEIVLNHLDKDTGLNKLVRVSSFQKQSLTYIKGDFMLKEFNCCQFSSNLWKIVC